MAKSYQTNDVYNEINVNERYKAERKADPKIFFYKEGNPFLGFMHFLRRNPVPPKQIDEQKLMIDLTDYARKNKRSKIISGIVFFVCTIIMIILKGYYEINILIFLEIVGAIILISTIIAIIMFIIKSLVNKEDPNKYTLADYKNYVIGKAIEGEVQELVYEPHFGIPQSVYKDLNAIINGNMYHTEDLITGKYHDVYFAQSDLVVEYKDDDSSMTYFKGRWIGFTYPKQFQGTVIIKDKKFFYGAKRKKLSDIQLENPLFNEMFTVKSSDMHLAYYLLTPQIIERLMYLKQNAKGTIVACFKDGILHIFINNGQDSFEPNLRKINLMSDIQKFKYDFSLVSGIVAILNINDNIYVQHNEEPSYQQPYQNNPMPPINNNGF